MNLLNYYYSLSLKRKNLKKDFQSEEVVSCFSCRIYIFLYSVFLFIIETTALLFLETKDSFNLFITEQAKEETLIPKNYSYIKHKKLKKRVKFFTTTAFVCVLISTIITSSVLYFLMPGKPSADAATFNFIQSTWSGGADTENFPIHPDNQSNWTKYYSKDDNITAGNSISLSSQNNSVSETSDADFGDGSFYYTEVSGTGGDASIVFTGNTFPATFSGWSYRKPITLRELSGSALNDYQVKITVDTATLVSEGKMNSDCSDMRFSESDDNTEISYWIESGCNSSSTIVWAQTDLTASQEKIIYMYYGNSSASSVSTTDIFPNFVASPTTETPYFSLSHNYTVDVDFNFTTQPTSSYYGPGIKSDYSESTGCDTDCCKNNCIASGLNAQLCINICSSSDAYSSCQDFGCEIDDAENSVLSVYRYYSGYKITNIVRQNGYILSSQNTSLSALTTSVWHSSVLKAYNSTTLWYIDGNMVSSNTANVYTGGTVVLVEVGNGSVSYRNLRTRQYVSSEPTSSFGSEQIKVDGGDYVSSVFSYPSDVIYDTLDFSQSSSSGIEFPSFYLSWRYRKPITITNNESFDLTDYQTEITIDTASLISLGLMNSDCSDVRFTEGSGSAISYWLNSKTCNSSETKFWIKTNMTASDSKDVYIYYGNSGATSESSSSIFSNFIENPVAETPYFFLDHDYTFDFDIYFDEGISRNGYGVLFDYSPEGCNSNCCNSIGGQIGIQCSADCETFEYLNCWNSSGPDYFKLDSYYRDGIVKRYYYYQDGTSSTIKGGASSYIYESEWHQNTIKVYDSDFMWYIDSSLELSVADVNPHTYGSIYLTPGEDGEHTFSNLRVRKYTSLEPGISIGSQEEYITVSFQLRSASTEEGLSSATWYGPTGTDDYYTTSDTDINSVHSGDQYLQYKAYFISGVELDSITINASYSSVMEFSPYSTGTGSVLSSLSWVQTKPTGSNIKFQLRSAPNLGGLPDEENWTDYIGPDGTTDSYFEDYTGNDIIPEELTTGNNDDWIQYKLYLSATDELPIVDDIALEYVVNAQPQISVTSASQDSDGTVNIEYTLSDEDEGLDTYTAYVSAFTNSTLNEELTSSDETAITVTNVDNLPSSGTILIDDEMISYTNKSSDTLIGITRHINNTTASAHTSSAEIYFVGTDTTGTGNITDVTSSPSSRTMTWDISDDIPNIYLSNTAKIRVSVNDGNGAFQIGSDSSTALDILDTYAPQVNSITIDGRETPASITMDVTDDTDMQMKYALTEIALSAAEYEAYSSSADIYLNGATIIYFSFKDTKNNITSYTLTIPDTPINPLVQDVSNPNTGEYRLFYSFSPIDEPSNSFGSYAIYVSDTQSGEYSNLSSIDNRLINYYLDASLTESETKYYKVSAQDSLGNYSEFSQLAYGTANGYQDVGEGAGEAGDSTAPTISNPVIANLANSTTTITFTTNELSDSAIRFSTDTSYNSEQGVPTYVSSGSTHSVTLIGLSENTKYYYQVVSRDASGNTGTLTDAATQYFTTSTDTISPIISDISSDISDSSVNISFTTDEASTIRIDYGTTQSYGLTYQNTNLNLDHNITLTDLSPNSTYYFRVTATDGSVLSNQTQSEENTFTTLDFSDVTAPTISDVSILSTTYSTATITFSTNELSSSLVDFGLTENLGSLQGYSTTRATSHSITLIGLSPSTTYYFKPKATDSAGNTSTTDTTYTLITDESSSENNAPNISNVNILDVSAYGATVTWTTDISSDSIVGYSTNQTYTNEQGSSPLTTSHSVTLSSLTPNTTYYLKLKSREVGGEITELTLYNESLITFTTSDGEDTTAPIITYTGISNITSTRATITFTTNENSNTLIDYSTTEGVYTSTQGRYSDDTSSHTITLTGLNSETTYYFRIRSEDSSRNSGKNSNGYSFTTLSSTDKDAPNISNITVESTTTTTATINWTTNEASSSLIDFGISLAYGKTQGNSSEMTTSHSITLAGLSPNTTYYFKVKSTDENGNLRTDDNDSQGYTFNTITASSSEDVTAPAISSTTVSNVTTNTAIITWTTDEESDSLVSYGISSYSQEKASSTLTTSHSINLINLSPGKTYSFQVKSQDMYGNSSTDNDSYTFTTLSGSDTTPPTISNVEVLSYTDTTATITWTTDENSSSLIDFGTTSTSLISTYGNYSEQVTNHSVTVYGLTPSTTYYFAPRSVDSSSNSSTDNGGYSFTTSAEEETDCPVCSSGGGSTRDRTAPTISDINITNITSSSATITWITNEDGYSLVEYDRNESLNDSILKGDRDNFSKTHSVILTNLSSAITHYYIVSSADSSGNLAKSQTQTFTTLASDGTTPEQSEDLISQTEEKIKELASSGLSDEEIREVISGASSSFKITSINPEVSNLTNNSVTITWQTDRKANSVIKYQIEGQEDASVKETGNFSSLTYEHNVHLSNLSPDTTYQYQVQSTDVLGNTVKTDWYNITTDPTANIYNVTISNLNLNSATIEWKTSVPASEEIEYGIDEYSSSEKNDTNEKGTSHIIKLINLKSGNTYNYRIKGIDINGNIISSDNYTFTTYTLPKIESYSIKSVGENEIQLEWTTNMETDSTVKYTDVQTNETKSQGENILLKQHTFTLSSLDPGKEYTIQIQGRDSYGNQVVSQGIQITTLIDTTSPTFGRVSVETTVSQSNEEQVRTIVSYTTSEPTTTQIFYSQDDSFSQSTDLDSNYTTNHTVVITEFKPASIYKFRIEAVDESNNKQTSQDFTVLVPERTKSVIQMITDNFESTFSWLGNIGK